MRKHLAVLVLLSVSLAVLTFWSPFSSGADAPDKGVELHQLLEYRGNSGTAGTPSAEPLDHWQYTGVNTTIWR